MIWIIGNPRENSLNGIVQHVGFRGHAAFKPFDDNTARQLFSKYLGENEEFWDLRFKKSLEDPDAFLLGFVPETAVVRDQSYPPVDG